MATRTCRLAGTMDVRRATPRMTTITPSQADSKLAEIVEQYMVVIQSFVEPIRSVHRKLREESRRRGPKLSPAIRKQLLRLVARTRTVGTRDDARSLVDQISACGVFVLMFDSCEDARRQQDVLLPQIDRHYWPLRRMIREAPFLVTDEMIRDLMRDDSAQTLQFMFALLYDVRRQADGSLLKCYARQSAGITDVHSTQGFGKALLSSRSARKLESVDPSIFHQLFDGQSYAPVFVSTEQQLIQYALRSGVHACVVTADIMSEAARRLADAVVPEDAFRTSPHAGRLQELARTLRLALMDHTPFLASHHAQVLLLLQDARRQVSTLVGAPAYSDALQQHAVAEVAAIFQKETACAKLGSNAQRVHVKVHAECAVCHQSGPGLKHCARCKKSFYCGKEHQRQHWPEHRQVCG